MLTKISTPIAVLSEELMLAEISHADAIKSLEELANNPELKKQVADIIKHMKPGQKPIVNAAMNPAAKAIIIALMSLAGAVFADPSGTAQQDLARAISSPGFSIENVTKIENTAEKNINKDIDGKIKEINDLMAQKDKGKPADMAANVGGQHLIGTNEIEAKILQHMVKIDNVLKAQLNSDSLSKSDYDKKIKVMTNSFERGKPIQL
jgi:hypothetical protein